MEQVPTGEGVKWFGEGFDGFPKRLPDDCVEYMLYVIDEELQNVAALRRRLNEILKSITELSKTLLKDYIWQRDPFQMEIQASPDTTQHQSSNASVLHRLKGRTDFGDSIADEWLIVYLLLELSKRHPDAWIRVYDTDGEFLLIEAANALPKWLNPDVAENRVWLNGGHLRIIPLDDGIDKYNISTEEALWFIEKTPQKLIISPFIEDEAFFRVRDYPGAISSTFHHALITIPRNLAYILHYNLAYISPATEAFYLRDPISLKPLASKDLSTLQFPPQDFVTVSAKFTKVGFAQLKSQMFDCPPAWTGIIPRLHDTKVSLGMKVACGFEMLVRDPQRQDHRSVREIKLLLEDVESGDQSLPGPEVMDQWPKLQDDEKWLDVDYNDFEKVLSGDKSKPGKSHGKGFGDKSAQENLEKMVSRFEDFLNDDDAGPDGVDGDDDTSSEEDSDEGEDKHASFDEAEFEKAMKQMMGMPPDEVDKSGLLAEARRLAIEDAEGSADDMSEDEEMKKVMELMEQELKSHGALKASNRGKSAKKDVKPTGKVVFGPEPPPSMLSAVSKEKSKVVDDDDSDVGPGDVELSSDDEDFNDVDLGLAKNMLESFKGQAGLAGPAGNLMRAMGVNMPRDEVHSEDE